MREIRLSGLEGGETQSNASSLPLSIARTAGREPRSTIGPLYDRYKKNTATRADPLGSILKIETQWDRRKPFERDNV